MLREFVLCRVPILTALVVLGSAPMIPSVAGASAPDSRAPDRVDEIIARGVLVAGVRDDIPPFGFLDFATREVVGIDVDLVRQVAQRLRVPLRLKTVTERDWVSALVDGEVDIVAAGIDRTPDRARLVDFSALYFDSSQAVLAPSGAIASTADLSGKRVGVAEGGKGAKAVAAAAPTARCYFFSDPAAAVEALRKGEIDAISSSGGTLYSCLSRLPPGAYEVPAAVRLTEEGFRLAVRKGEPRLLDLVNSALVEANRAGTMKAVFDKWMVPGPAGERNASPLGSGAFAVVTRPASAERRYLAVAVRGFFRPGFEVLLSDPRGEPVGRGRVDSVFETEVYVDVSPDASAGVVGSGFLVTSGVPADDARRYAQSHQDVLSRVRAEAQREEERTAKEIGAEQDRERRERQRYQEEMTKLKMNLDYQYGYYYRYPDYYWR